jgi:ferrochelatase
VRQFIGEMLSDPLLTDQPRWLSHFLARKIIAPIGCVKTKKKYELIWRREEPLVSPVVYYMQELARALEERKGVPVEIAMRYGEPDITQAFRDLERRCPLLHEVIVFPLFPHYAQSTTKTAVDEIGRVFYKRPHSFRLKIREPYYNHPAFINALAVNAEPYLANGVDRLVFSYHSLPVNQVERAWQKGKEFDYVYQLKETNHLLCNQLQILQNQTMVLYASQRSKNWLKPFLDAGIGELPKMGMKKIAVAAPGFSIDNLETLYDIDILARKLFMEAGGEEFIFIPSLNANEVWVDAVWKIVSGV